MSKPKAPKPAKVDKAPWKEQQPYFLGDESKNIAGIFPEANKTYQQGIDQKFFPGQTYANFSPEAEQAMTMRTDLAQNNGGLGPANTFNEDVINGKYMMGGNNFMAGYGDNIIDQANSQAALAGGGGSAYHAGAITKELAGASARQWNNDIANRQRSTEFAPQLDRANYAVADQLAQVGSQRMAQDQLGINEEMKRYGYDVDNKWEQLRRYQSMVGGVNGSSQTATNPMSRNRAAGALGGAAAGAGIASAMKLSNPYAAAAVGGGALLGGFF